MREKSLAQANNGKRWVVFELTTDRLRVRSAIRCIAVKVGVSDEVTVCVVIAFRVHVLVFFIKCWRVCHNPKNLPFSIGTPSTTLLLYLLVWNYLWQFRQRNMMMSCVRIMLLLILWVRLSQQHRCLWLAIWNCQTYTVYWSLVNMHCLQFNR